MNKLLRYPALLACFATAPCLAQTFDLYQGAVKLGTINYSGPALPMPQAIDVFESGRKLGTVINSTWSGPSVNMAKLAVARPADQHATSQIRKLALDPATGLLINPGAFKSTPSEIGAFRVNCAFAGFNKDDAIASPGRPGVSHLHTYFGSFANAATTAANIRSLPWSTCDGGSVNKSSYWVPSMIDTRDGTPQVPTSNMVYYKGSYFMPGAGTANIVEVPAGLRMVTGNASNANPAVDTGIRYICYGPNGANPGWSTSITDAYNKGTCVPGADFVMNVQFPNCWDGLNLDSPDHKAHVVDAVEAKQSPFNWYCPADHPKQLPTINFNIHYSVPDVAAVSRWRLSSDMYDPRLPAGLSGHGDYMMGWDPALRADLFSPPETIFGHIVRKCLRGLKDGHGDLLCDDVYTLY